MKLLLILLWILLIGVCIRVGGVSHTHYFDGIGPDVEAQISSLRSRLHRNHEEIARVMLTHTFYAYSLANTVLLDPDNTRRREAAIEEILFIIGRVESPWIRDRYPNTQIPHGIYYQGERALTLGALSMLNRSHSEEEQAFHEITSQLSAALDGSPMGILETYPGYTWPVDNLPAIYALALHDQVYGTDHSTTIDRFLEFLRSNLDPSTGLMPARFDYATGAQKNVPRGCALSLSFPFLAELDPEFARSQYSLFRRQFFKPTLGFAGVREYPSGIVRASDIDSGPIINEVGAGASGLGLIAMHAMGDSEAWESLIQLSEIIGLRVSGSTRTTYLLGQLPVADAIILWGKTHTPWLARDPSANIDDWPRRGFHPWAFRAVAAVIAIGLVGATLRSIDSSRVSLLRGDNR